MRRPKVIICPLNWGLGHASRCIPIAREFQNQNFEVIFASSGQSLSFLKREMPDSTFESLPDYGIKYYHRIPIWLSIGLQFFKLLFSFSKEHRTIKHLVKKHNPDLIVSDNRPGAYHSGIKSIYISHQIKILDPLGKFHNMATWVHQHYIREFNQLWIPDCENSTLSLAGELSHSNNIVPPPKYLGHLSRLGVIKNAESPNHILVILSGVEPHRTKLEEIILEQIKSLQQYSFTILGGKAQHDTSFNPSKNIVYTSFANQQKMEQEIAKAELIICRSGYSTLMDLLGKNKKLLLIPGPGQTEQEYLAKRLPVFHTQQKRLNLSKQIPLALNSPGLTMEASPLNTSLFKNF